MKFPVHRTGLVSLLATFDDLGVEYLVIGSAARSHYRDVSSVGDLDLLVRPTPENSQRVVSAIHKVYEGIFPGGIMKIDPKFFAKPGAKVPPSAYLRADILTPVESFSFCEALSRSIEIQVSGNVQTRIAAEHDLDVLDALRAQSESESGGTAALL